MSEQAKRRGGTEDERRDRNLTNCHAGAPGFLRSRACRSLFALSAVVYLQSGWPDVTAASGSVYYVTLLCSPASSICSSTAARHRIRSAARISNGSSEARIASCWRASDSSRPRSAPPCCSISMVVFDTTLASRGRHGRGAEHRLDLVRACPGQGSPTELIDAGVRRRRRCAGRAGRAPVDDRQVAGERIWWRAALEEVHQVAGHVGEGDEVAGPGPRRELELPPREQLHAHAVRRRRDRP